MKSNLTRLVAVDPGKMTGISVFTQDGQGAEPILIQSAEITEEEFAPYLRAQFLIAQTEGQILKVACESFIVTLATAKKSQAPFSLELIGILKQTIRDYGHTLDILTLQPPSRAKDIFPNEKLRKLGYWHRGGAGHALDSIRHGLLYFLAHNWKPTGLLD